MFRVAAGVATGVLFVVFLLALVPARLVNGFLPGTNVIMQGYSGTLWRGAASRCLVATGSGYLHLGRVRWSLSPLSLLTLSPSLTLESTWGRQRINTDLRISGPEDLELTDLDAMVSAQLLQQFLPLSISGDFSVQAEELYLEKGFPSRARGRLIWQNAAWDAGQGSSPLGSYAMDFEQQPGGALEGELVTISGAVSANGSVRLLGKDYSLDILVSGEGGLGSQLEQALSLIAQPVSEGYRIKFDGQLIDLE